MPELCAARVRASGKPFKLLANRAITSGILFHRGELIRVRVGPSAVNDDDGIAWILQAMLYNIG